MSSEFGAHNSGSQTELPSLSSGSSSLAQSARLKQLNTARGILIGVGLLTIALNIFQFVAVERLVDEQFNKEIIELRRQGMQIDQVKLAELRASSISAVKLVCIGLVFVGALFLVGAALIKSFPVPVTIISLVVYVGCAVIFGILDPATLLQGIIIKVIIVFALVKAVQAAMAYQREMQSNTGFAG
jgi:hypothetical protein